MDNAQIKSLLSKLMEGTRNRKYPWKQVSGNVFQLIFPNSQIFVIEQTTQPQPEMSYLVQIYNQQAKLVTQLNTGDFNKAGVETARQTLDQLVKLIKEQVMKLDATIEDVFKNL